jgi:hypothetical protein
MSDQAGVYYILNLKNDRIYVGQSAHIAERIIGHKNALKRSGHKILDLQKDWDAYGENAFEFGTLVNVAPSHAAFLTISYWANLNAYSYAPIRHLYLSSATTENLL